MSISAGDTLILHGWLCFHGDGRAETKEVPWPLTLLQLFSEGAESSEK